MFPSILSMKPGAERGINPPLEHSAASATIRLDVPKVAQARQMSCWYASACMVNYYFEAGPRQGLPRAWENNNGITPARFADLAKNEGLADATTFRGAANTYGQTELYLALYWLGPLWCAGGWFGFKHIIVLTGVEGGDVIINDPDKGVEKTNTVSWFNQKIDHGVANHLMCRRPEGVVSMFVGEAK